jgi:hypothetical protein
MGYDLAANGAITTAGVMVKFPEVQMIMSSDRSKTKFRAYKLIHLCRPLWKYETTSKDETSLPISIETRKNRTGYSWSQEEIRPLEKSSPAEAGCPALSFPFSPMEFASGFF